MQRTFTFDFELLAAHVTFDFSFFFDPADFRPYAPSASSCLRQTSLTCAPTHSISTHLDRSATSKPRRTFNSDLHSFDPDANFNFSLHFDFADNFNSDLRSHAYTGLFRLFRTYNPVTVQQVSANNN